MPSSSGTAPHPPAEGFAALTRLPVSTCPLHLLTRNCQPGRNARFVHTRPAGLAPPSLLLVPFQHAAVLLASCLAFHHSSLLRRLLATGVQSCCSEQFYFFFFLKPAECALLSRSWQSAIVVSGQSLAILIELVFASPQPSLAHCG